MRGLLHKCPSREINPDSTTYTLREGGAVNVPLRKRTGAPDCATIDNLAGTCTEVSTACCYQKTRARRLPSPMILRTLEETHDGSGVGRITRLNPKRSIFRH